jgi:hypothetical protein
VEHVSEKREDARRSERDLEQFLNAVSKYVQTEHLQKITDANIGLLDDCESSVSDHHCQPLSVSVQVLRQRSC